MKDNTHYFKYDHGQTVQIVETAPECLRPGTFVAVVGMITNNSEDITPWGTFPVGTDFYTIEYDDGSSMEIPEKYLRIVGKGLGIIRIHFDNQCIWYTEDDVEMWRLSWENVTGIGYVSGYPSWQHTHFLVLRDNINPPKFYMLAICWNGVQKLCDFIDKTKDVKYAPEEKLANYTIPKTTTIWPASESGKPLGLWGNT